MINCVGRTENRSRVKVYIILHVMLMIYSMSGICSKMAAKEEFLAQDFVCFMDALYCY